jgi:hypothetical protein
MLIPGLSKTLKPNLSTKLNCGVTSGGATPTGALLDSYTTILGWSLTQLKTTQNKCMRVRRDSDNAEQDINYVSGYIDITYLTTFVGAGDGFVVTLYDCNGLHNITQSTNANQPKIVEAGVFLTNGIKFETTNQTCVICSYFANMYPLTPPFSVYSKVWNYAMDNQSRVLFQDWNTSPKWGSRINTGGYQYQLTSSAWIYGQHIVVGNNECMFNWVDQNENGFVQYSNNYNPIYDTVADSLTSEDANFYIGSLPWDTAGDFQFSGFAIFPQLMDFELFRGV